MVKINYDIIGEQSIRNDYDVLAVINGTQDTVSGATHFTEIRMAKESISKMKCGKVSGSC